LIALSALGCEGNKGAPTGAASQATAPSPAAAASAILAADAGLLESSDPPAPPGDLKADVDRFVNVETCVRERAALDPLVADAIRAIGYDTLLRDACRLLEATKDKKPESCDKLDSSALRARCHAMVAMVAQTPDACPLQFEGVPTRGRHATCLAVAGRDPRLCAAEARAAARATCEALATRDDAKCDGLMPADRPSCKREVTRWKALLAAPLDGLAKLPQPRGKLVVRGDSGTSDPGTPEADLSSEVARGAVVVTSRDRARVELGMVGESETSRIAPSPNRRPRFGIAVLFEPGATSKDAPKPVLERVELEVPGEATLVHPAAKCECRLTNARVERTRGGEVALALVGTMGLGGRSYRIDVDLATYVRDVVSEQAGSGGRVLPPVHPAIGLAGLSGTAGADAGSATPRPMFTVDAGTR